jgi:hypothetical protein
MMIHTARTVDNINVIVTNLHNLTYIVNAINKHRCVCVGLAGGIGIRYAFEIRTATLKRT